MVVVLISFWWLGYSDDNDDLYPSTDAELKPSCCGCSDAEIPSRFESASPA